MGKIMGPTKQTKTIWKLKLEGNNSVQICNLLGLPKSLVDSALSRGIEAGVLQKRKSNPLLFNNSNYIKMGNIGWLIKQLDRDQLYWLADESLKTRCETMAEMILEIVRDAYEETKVD